MASLYEIDNAIANFVPEVDEFTGELLNADILDRLNMERDTKIESIALYIKNLSALAADIKAEKDNLAERLKSTERKADSLKEYLANALNGEKFETGKCKVSYRKSSQVIFSDNFTHWARLNAPDLVKEYVEYKPDKTAIKEAIKGGREVFGAEIIENVNLQVK